MRKEAIIFIFLILLTGVVSAETYECQGTPNPCMSFGEEACSFQSGCYKEYEDCGGFI